MKCSLKAAGLRPDTPVIFYDHHFGHSLPALFYNPDWQDALLYPSDGGAETGYYSYRWFHDGQIDTLFGGDEMLFEPHPVSSLALAYGFATLSLGYKINRHEGKLTGLAACGRPTGYDSLRPRFHVDDGGRITSDFDSNEDLKRAIFDYAAGSSHEDVSATVQKLVEDVTLESVTRLVEKHPTRNLGLAGGLFANVRVNQVLADSGLFDCVFIVPPMSDQGIALGGMHQHLPGPRRVDRAHSGGCPRRWHRPPSFRHSIPRWRPRSTCWTANWSRSSAAIRARPAFSTSDPRSLLLPV